MKSGISSGSWDSLKQGIPINLQPAHNILPKNNQTWTDSQPWNQILTTSSLCHLYLCRFFTLGITVLFKKRPDLDVLLFDKPITWYQTTITDQTIDVGTLRVSTRCTSYKQIRKIPRSCQIFRYLKRYQNITVENKHFTMKQRLVESSLNIMSQERYQ